ncbi:MAG: alpha/beta hydrolase [Pseudomonadales bacterium]|nr:alpha/beta hydrolase [Pseudomonadales bacterium]
MTSTDPRTAPTSHSYYSERLRLHYLDWGNAEAPPILLIHGVQDHCHSWDWVCDELHQDYHLIVPDLRGHGDSEWNHGAPYSTLDYIYDIHQLIAQRNLAPVQIVAHSMGGNIACLFAGLYPELVSSLTSIEGIGAIPQWYPDGTSPVKRVRQWIRDVHELASRTPRRYDSLDDACERMQQSNPHLSKERARHLTIHGSNQNEDGTYSWKFDNYTHSRPPFSINYQDLIAIWENISCPTLLINARQGYSHRTGQSGSLKHFKSATLIDIDEAGHWLHHDQLDAFLSHLKPHLEKNTQRSPG